MNYQDTRSKVHSIMADLGARQLSECAGPNKTGPMQSVLEFWNIGGQCVIVQYWVKAGGCQHYMPGAGLAWDAMETQLHQLAAASL